MIHRGINQCLVVVRGSTQLSAGQLLIPLRSKLLLHSIEVPPCQFALQIVARLLNADERSAYANLYRLPRRELRICSAACCGSGIFHPVSIHPRGSLLELDDEIALEVRQCKRPKVRIHSVRIETRDLACFWTHGSHACNSWPRCLNNDACHRTFGKCKSKCRAALSGGHLLMDLDISA